MESAAVPAALLALARTAPRREAALVAVAAGLGELRFDDLATDLRRWAYAASELDGFVGRIGAAFQAADGEPTILYLDPTGDGRIIEVYGDLGTATKVAVVVPGIESTLANEARGLRQSAKHLYDEARSMGDDHVAVIAWLGYDTPDLLGAPFDAGASGAARDLAAFVRSLGLDTSVTTTVVAHSYGSLVTGVALRDFGLDVDRVVVLGSPGMDVSRASELHLGATDLYALRAPFDVVSWSEHFGRDPSDPRFGATRLATGTGDHAPSGHSSYFDSGTVSLHNIAAVVAGRPDLLAVQHPSTAERASDAVDDLWGVAIDTPVDDLQRVVDEVAEIAPPVAPVIEAADQLIDLGQRVTSPDLWENVTEDVWQTLRD
jgi:pimeloyl-ACP methyl ester carboxylesterase